MAKSGLHRRQPALHRSFPDARRARRWLHRSPPPRMEKRSPGKAEGTLEKVISESTLEHGENEVTLSSVTGNIAANLQVGSDLTSCATGDTQRTGADVKPTGHLYLKKSLGQIFREDAKVRFDFALPALRFQRLCGLDWLAAEDLRSIFPAALTVAQLFDREVIGLWAAWKHAQDTEKKEEAARDSWLASEAAALGLPFISVTPIDGLWRWAGTWFSRPEDFPEKSRRAKRTRGQPCPGSLDNPVA